MNRPRTGPLLLGVALALAASCGADDDAPTESVDVVATDDIPVDASRDDGSSGHDEVDATDGTAPITDDGAADDDTPLADVADTTLPNHADDSAGDGDDIDLSLTRDDVDCSPESLDSAGETFTSVHVVVDGSLGEVCLGEENDIVLDAWRTLAVIAPRLARADLGLFGGFVADDTESGEVTLAYVLSLDDDGTAFQMSINLDSFADGDDETMLTIAHEFSHVFSQGPGQLDRESDGPDSCGTYFNGDGCFVVGSLLAQWVEEFWPADLLASVDGGEEATIAAGEERCELHADFLGTYAASNPEEDFAETFSAFVFDVDVAPGMAAKLEWLGQQPGLVEFRDRAAAAGLTPIEHDFDVCG